MELNKPKFIIRCWNHLNRDEAHRGEVYRNFIQDKHWPAKNLERKKAKLHKKLRYYKATPLQLEFYLWYQSRYMHITAVNGQTSWCRSFYYIAAFLEKTVRKVGSPIVDRIKENKFSLPQIAFNWTSDFEKLNSKPAKEAEVFMLKIENFCTAKLEGFKPIDHQN